MHGILILPSSVAVAVSALPQKFPEDPHTKKDAIPKESDEVGWQSILWGLFALAIHAMSIPSSLDTRLLKRQLLLFPMRISPIICVADVLDFLYHILKLMRKENRSLSEALSEARSSSSIKRPLVFVRKQSAIKKHPIASTLWFLGTATQAVKIFGFQGQGIWWAKVIAGMYIGSYLVMIWISLLPQNSSDILVSQGVSRTAVSRLEHSAIALHIILINYAIFQVFHIRGVEAICDTESGFNLFLCAVLYMIVSILSFVPTQAIIACSVVGILYVLSGAGRIPESFFKEWFFVFLILFTAGVGGSMWVIYNVGNIYLDILKVGNVVVQGGLLVLLMFVGCVMLYTAGGWFLKRAFHFENPRGLTKSEFSAITFAIVSVVIVGLYCCFAYDSAGTVKPSWTDKLG